jgi:hypothetical protein
MKGIIYKIITDASDGKFKIYIGSTTKTLKLRQSLHEHHYKRYVAGLFNYVSSFEIIKHNWYEFGVIKEVEVNNKIELGRFEKEAMEQYSKDADYIVVNSYHYKKSRGGHGFKQIIPKDRRKVYNKKFRDSFSSDDERKEYFRKYYKKAIDL